MSEFWFRVPLDVSKNLDGGHKASDDEATVDLLGRWHQGGDPSIGQLRKLWGGWSADRVIALRRKLAAWADENGAARPGTIDIGFTPPIRPNEIGRSDVGTTVANGVSPDRHATFARQKSDPHAGVHTRASSSERERETERSGDPPKAPRERRAHGPQLPLTADGAPVHTDAAGAPDRRATQPVLDDAATLYAAYRSHHLRKPLTASPDDRKSIARILREAGDLERAVLYMTWVHESEDHYARQLRGLEPIEGTTKSHLALSSLERKVDSRCLDAEAWDARGRTVAVEVLPARDTRQAPPGFRRPSADDLVDEGLRRFLAQHDPQPTE